jgi:hypothetical protein
LYSQRGTANQECFKNTTFFPPATLEFNRRDEDFQIISIPNMSQVSKYFLLIFKINKAKQKQNTFYLFLTVLGFKLRASMFTRQALSHLSHSTSPVVFLLGIFEIGSHKLFAQAGFKL